MKTVWEDGVEYIVYPDGTREALVPYEEIMKTKKNADTLNERGRQKQALKKLLTWYKGTSLAKKIKECCGSFNVDLFTTVVDVSMVSTIIQSEIREVDFFDTELSMLTYYDNSFLKRVQEKIGKNIMDYVNFLELCQDGLDSLVEEMERKEGYNGRESTS